MKIYINKIKKQTKKIPHKKFQNPIEKGQINITVNIHMTSQPFPVIHNFNTRGL
jgi:hypothetical protein